MFCRKLWAFFALLLLSCLASAQATLTSITIIGAPGSLSTLAFAGLTATGHYSDGSSQPNLFVSWSSSDPATVSVSTGGVVTALKGTVNPVTITATSGAVSANVQLTVTPQTSLFSADGSNLSIYDITFGMKPQLVTSVNYYTQLGGGNGNNPIPMALAPGPSPSEQYLFIANPAYLSNNSSDFVVEVIDTKTNTKINEIASLCYPTSLAVASHFLYVVNAGPTVAQGTAATGGGCSSSTPANVQYYDLTQIANKPWNPVGTLTPANLETGTTVTGSVPLGVAASSDQTDNAVYVASTKNYSASGTGTGLLTTIQTGTSTVTNAASLNSGTATSGFGISPLGLTVITAYPSWFGAAVHTAFMVGPGFNTSGAHGAGTYFYYVSDQCQNASCPTAPQFIFAAAGPSTYGPLAAGKSPDGLIAFAADDTFYLDSFTSTDGTSSSGFSNSNFFTTQGTNTQCSGSCLPITSIATTADASYVFGSFIGEIDRLVPTTLSSDARLASVSPLSLLVTQNPEIQLTINLQGTTMVSGSFVVHGNYQNTFSSGYPFSCDWGEDNINSGNLWSNSSVSIAPTGGTVFPNLPTYQTGAPASVSIIPSAAADANGLSGTIINPIPVGPITTQIAAASASVQLATTDQFSGQVTNATDQTVSWQINGAPCTTSGSSCPFGTIDASGLYTAPGTLPSGSVQIRAVPNADPTDTSAISNVIVLTLVTPPTANVSPLSLTFSAQNVGTTSAAQKVTVTNTGQANLVLAATPLSFTGTDTSDYAIASGTTCVGNLSIAPNSNCVIEVTFTPESAGTRTANLVITDNSGGISGTMQTVTLTGTGAQLTGTASVSPLSLTFSNQNVGTTSAAQKVTVTNTGQANLVLAATPLSFAGTDPSDYAIASGTTCTASLSILPSASCVIEVTFTPGSAGTRTANLVITDNSGGAIGTMQTVTLTGAGVQLTGTASVSPLSLTFSNQNVGTTSAAQKVTVTNTGQANLVLAATPLSFAGTDPSDYAIASGTTCTASLSILPSASCVIEVTFTPGSAGTRTANLVITDNSSGISGSTQTVTLSGTGQQPGTGTASISPTSLTFSVQTVGTTSTAQKVTVTNTGQASLVLAATPLSVTGTDPSDYVVASGTTCTAGLSLAPNSSCVIQMTFTPATAGTLTANLVITDNSGGVSGSTQIVTLTGTGQQVSGTASVSPSSLTFGTQNVGTISAAQKVTVTNTGQANLVLGAPPVSFTGTDPSDYAIASGTTCTASLSILPSASCVIEVTFTPGSAGTRTANLVITDNSGGAIGTMQTVTLTGAGVQLTGTASVSPSSLIFGTQNVGTISAAQKVTVTNTGQANLVLAATPVSITGASSDYAIASGTTCTANLSIAPNSNCVIQVSFGPMTVGVLTASLVITDNSGGIAGATQSVSLTGTGFQQTTAALFPSNPAVEIGLSQQFTANFTPSNAGGPVTWSVSGSGCGGKACGNIDANGVYTVSSTVSAVAVDTVTATLASNTSVSGSTQVSIFRKPVLVKSGQSQTVAAGQPATYNLALSPGTGDTAASLTIECHQNTLPTGVSCPQVIVQPSNSGINFTFTIDTTAMQSASALNRQWLWTNLAFILPSFVLVSFAGRRKSAVRNKRLLVLLGLFLLPLCLLGVTACGTNGTFGQTTQKNFGGTPSGTYSIEIDGVGPNSIPEAIGTVSLTVQ